MDLFGQVRGQTEDAGFLRARAKAVNSDAEKLHSDSQVREWRVLGSEKAKKPALELLSSLSELGFAWRHIAQLTGVSVPAVRKWRKGQKVSADSRRDLASVNAAVEIVQENYLVADVASWFEMPILDEVPITPIDLYSTKRVDLVFEAASGHADPEDILTKFDENWREKFRSPFEVFEAEDGFFSIRAKG
ncbi:hypothetical protein CSTAT_12790 [Corynebacterium stationis]|nr:hypothetical protein CSTAT_12790 [Corynebacterium stationis]